MTDKSKSAQPDLKIDNERTRVIEWRFAPGAATGHHRHEYDYVIVPLTTGKLKIVHPDGSETISELVTGQPYFRQAGVEHDVINANEHDFAFMEVEIK